MSPRPSAASAPSSYVRPHSLAAALDALVSGEALILAGGTDIYPAHVAKPLPRRIVDVASVAEMRGISFADACWRLGGACTWSEIAAAPLPPAFAGLQQAARQVGAVQVQNRGTVAGNLCNASPAADGIPPLLTLDAAVELASKAGRRVVPLADFITGYRQTALRPGELLTAVLVPESSALGRATFEKLGARAFLVISIVMAAVRIETDAAGAITTARVAIGAAADRARRLETLERDLVGHSLAAAPAIPHTEHLAPLSPIDDGRATARYRSDAALALIAAALARAGEA